MNAPQPEPATGRELATARLLNAPRAAVYRACTTPDLLRQWWGPAGFTNTFQQCEIRPGGAWRYVMHGPDGVDYANESEFLEVAPERIVIRHNAPVHVFTLTVQLDDLGDATRVIWRMLFETASERARVRDVVLAANEQNLDRLQALLDQTLGLAAIETNI